MEHRVTEREWAEEERKRLLRRADKGAITRSRREAESEGPVLKSSGAPVRQQVNAAPYSLFLHVPDRASNLFFQEHVDASYDGLLHIMAS